MLRSFEKCLLSELGYGLNLEHEAHSGAPIVAEAQYQYVLDCGPLAVAGNATGVLTWARSEGLCATVPWTIQCCCARPSA